MNFKEIAPKIIACVGGAENIQTHTHCMTRLRLVLVDKSKADVEGLKAISGVQGVVDKGGMFQIIIGTSVEQLYNEMLPMMPATGAKAPVKENLDGGKKESILSQIFAYISGCITPTLPILVGSGLISAVLALVKFFAPDAAGSTNLYPVQHAGSGCIQLPARLCCLCCRTQTEDQ